MNTENALSLRNLLPNKKDKSEHLETDTRHVGFSSVPSQTFSCKSPPPAQHTPVCPSATVFELYLLSYQSLGSALLVCNVVYYV